MEGSLTHSDHSTTVPLHYLTHAPHKSYRPKAQLLPGPQCHTCPNRFASNCSLPPPPSALPAFSLRAPFSARPTFPAPGFFLHPARLCRSACPSHHVLRQPCCLSVHNSSAHPWLSFVFVQHMLRLASRRIPSAGPVHFISCEDGHLRSPRGMALCHQHLASILPRNTASKLAFSDLSCCWNESKVEYWLTLTQLTPPCQLDVGILQKCTCMLG